MNFATDWADTKLGAAEIQVIRTIGPVRGTYAQNVLAVPGFHIAHRLVAALAAFQAGKIMATIGRLLDYFRRNLEHLATSPARVSCDSDRSSGKGY
jgi:hypothetical protein